MTSPNASGRFAGLTVAFVVVLALALSPLWVGRTRRDQQPAQAQSTATVPHPPDPAHGQLIAMTGTDCGGTGRCFSCYQCHAPDGAGLPIAGFPRLSGLPFYYLYSALRGFQSGARKSAVMQPVAAALDDAAMRDLAAYFEQARPDPASPRAPVETYDPRSLRRGMTLALWGDDQMRIPACNNCHGPQGQGLPPTYPYLAHQYAAYLADQLRAFKLNRRSGDSLNVMEDIAARLTPEQIEDVSRYYASIGGATAVLALRPAITMHTPSRTAVKMTTPASGGQP